MGACTLVGLGLRLRGGVVLLCVHRGAVAFRVRRRLVAGDDVDEEVEHVRLCEGGGDVGALEGAALVVFGVDPGAHGEFRDEDVAALGEENGGFSGDHLYVGVGFHYFFDAR
ncbi:hypothetical protein KEM55_000927 [Ascosphaera atra]|nr:hypothetical protein KEM55_000927 [Ascosphaera atra]